jgi:hypothetical protein
MAGTVRVKMNSNTKELWQTNGIYFQKAYGEYRYDSIYNVATEIARIAKNCVEMHYDVELPNIEVFWRAKHSKNTVCDVGAHHTWAGLFHFPFIPHSTIPNHESKTLKISMNLKEAMSTDLSLYSRMNGYDGYISTTLFECIKIISHELVHAKQFVKKELTCIDGKMHWMGEDMSEVPYEQQGHEVEAFEDMMVIARQVWAALGMYD